jgi:DNA-binding response OmpR family regulator
LTSATSAQQAPSAEERRQELDAKHEMGRKAPEERPRLDGVRILLMEGDPDTLETLRSIFDERGAEVITAASTPEALDALERRDPNALILDIASPDQDGYELIRQVRERDAEQGGKIPAIAVTARATAEDRMRALSSGFQMHMARPIDPDEMIAVVASLVGRINF